MLELKLKGTTSRALPQASPDTAENDITISRYGDLKVTSMIPTKHMLADEGSYFIGTNSTPGTALAYALTTGFSDTTPFIYMYNQSRPADQASKRIHLDYIKIIVTTAPASSTQAYFAIKLDTALRSLTTDNTTTLTAVSPNMDIGVASQALLKAQNSATASVIAAASNTARVVARGCFGGLPVVGDELVITSGSPDIGSYSGLTAAQATCPGRKCSNCPPIVLGPGNSMEVHLWFPANATTALSYELEMGWWER